jgi:hypothetical protein
MFTMKQSGLETVWSYCKFGVRDKHEHQERECQIRARSRLRPIIFVQMIDSTYYTYDTERELQIGESSN